MIIFGGHNNQTTFNDLWLYNFTSRRWKELHSKSAVSPSPRYDHTVVLSGRRMYLFFGVLRLANGVTVQLTDYWYLDLERMEWTVLPNTLPMLPGGSGNFAALDQEHERIVFYLTTPKTPSFWFYFVANNSWLPLTVQGHHSSRLAGATATLVADYSYLYVLGRPIPASRTLNASLTVLSSFNLYDSHTNWWTSLATYPGIYLGHVIVYAPRLRAIFVYGLDNSGAIHMWRYTLGCRHNCSKGGVCIGQQYCICPDNRGLDDCSIQCGEVCKHGYCGVQNVNKPQGGVCICDADYYGSQCQDYVPCVNGYVIMNATAPHCECQSGWRGVRCDVECPGGHLTPCSNHGQCTANATCLCRPGYVGLACENDERVCALPQLNCTTPTNTTITELTWCSKQNVFLTPMKIPMPENVSNLFPAPICEGDYPLAPCSAITKIATVSSFNDHSFVLVALQSGGFTMFDFNEEQLLGKWDTGHKSAITYIKAYVGTTTGIILTADTTKLALWDPLITNSSIILGLEDRWDSEIANDMTLFKVDSRFNQRSNFPFIVDYELLVGALFGDPAKNKWALQIRQYTYFSGKSSWFVKGNTTTYWLDLFNDTVTIMSFHFGSHQGFQNYTNIDATHPKCAQGEYVRDVIVLFSEQNVALYQARLSDFSIPHANFTLDFGVSNQNSDTQTIVFTVPDGLRINDVTFFQECFRRNHQSSSNLWLLIGVSNETVNALYTVQVAEFGVYDFRCRLPIDDSNLAYGLVVRNVSGKCAVLPINYCGSWKFWWDGVRCRPRPIDVIKLPIRPAKISHRFLETPSGLYDWKTFLNVPYQNTTISSALEQFNYHVVFITDYSQTIRILGFQEELCTESGLLTVLMNSIDLPAIVEDFEVSENGQHIFIAVSLQRWEIDSQNRLIEICNRLKYNSSNPLTAFLAPYQDLCRPPLGPPKRLDFSDLLLFLSMCNSGTYCPSLQRNYVAGVGPGNYTYLPGRIAPCPPQFYCPNGKIKPCPSGYICPNYSMVVPQKCEPNESHNTTCYQEMLAQELPCPAGTICVGMNVQPVLVQPGYYVNPREPIAPGKNCSEGWYCPLGASLPPVLCPAGFYCSHPAVIVPQPCPMMYDEKGNKVNSNTTYCPPGSTKARPCPAGYYCITPANITACDLGDYCPQGTQIAQQCPAGYVCPTPAKQELCPVGYYCPTGSYEAKKCSFFDYCPAGASSQHRWIAILADIVLVTLVVGGYKLYTFLRDRRQAKKLEEYEKNVKNRVNRFLINQVTQDIDKTSLLQLPSHDADFKDLHLRLPALSQRRYRVMLEIEFHNIELQIGKRKILKGVSGMFSPGRLSAIMGPSGAGKSSLISVLSGRTKRTGGVIYINGEMYDDLRKFKKVMGFVPQEDIMHRRLTVKEILKFNADARLAVSTTAEEKESLINDIIEVLGLCHVKYNIIGDVEQRGLSGGERKRVNIGMELASDPNVLFLDEPTSGLDSTAATEVVKCLQTIARVGNITVVCVIHQPRWDIFKLFDDVLFMGPGGTTVYHGTVERATHYFERIGFPVPPATNPADYFLDVISGKVVGEKEKPVDLESEWQKYKHEYSDVSVYESESLNNNNNVNSDRPARQRRTLTALERKLIHRRTAGFFRQLGLFLVRSFILETRDLPNIFLNLTLVFICGLLLGFVYNDSHYVGPVPPEQQAQCPVFIKEVCGMARKDEYVIQYTLLNMGLGLIAIAGALKVFGEERVTYWRESTTGTSSLAFFLGKNLATVGMLIIPPFVFLSIFYLLTSPRTSFWLMYSVLIGIQYACTGAGHLISLVFLPQNALLAGVSYEVICTLFAGGNPTLTKIYSYGILAKVLASMSYSRWGTECLYISELKQYAHEYDVTPSLRYWGYDINNFELDMIMLFTIGTVMRILAFVSLIVFHKNRRM